MSESTPAKTISFETIEYSVANQVAHIRLNRPDAANTLNLQLAQDLHQAVLACEDDSDVRAVLLSAEGKLFCAGGDLASFAEKGDAISEELKKVTFYAHDAFIRLMRMPAPVVTAVNGAAAGIGLSLALIGDYTIASSKASFTSAYTAAGLSPDGGCTSLLVELVGSKRAKELMLLNRRLSANEALDWGMINRVVEPEELAAAALELATTFANGPTLAYGAVKRLVSGAAKNNIEAQMTSESRMIAANAKTKDGKEGIKAFLEKRKPHFSGR